MDKTLTAQYKSKKFAIRIIHLYQYLCSEKKEFVLSKQLLRCGTSIGANLAESECAISKKDFLAKVYIALKECFETLYWLELLWETDYLSQPSTIPFIQTAMSFGKCSLPPRKHCLRL